MRWQRAPTSIFQLALKFSTQLQTMLQRQVGRLDTHQFEIFTSNINYLEDFEFFIVFNMH